MGVALLLLFLCSTICDDKKTDAVPFLSAKVVRGLWLSKGPKPLGLSGKSPHLRVVFSAKTLCKPTPLPLFCYKKESAYSDLWTHKKNVAMDKQKVNTTSSMNRKGYSSSYDCSRNSTNTSKPCSYRRINLCSQCRTRYAR